MQDILLSLVFVLCQLLFLGMVAGIFLLSRPEVSKRRGFTAWSSRLVIGMAAGIVAVTGVVDITSVGFGREQVVLRGSAGLVGEVAQGNPMIIRFDNEACIKWDLGNIACEADYRADYDARKRRWRVTGYSNGEKAVITATADNAERADSLSVWGALFRFDDAGIVYRSEQIAGTIKIQGGSNREPARP